MLVEASAFPGDKAFWTGQVLIGFRLGMLHSISCPVGLRHRTRGVNRVSGPCHTGNTQEKGKLCSEEYRRREHVIDDDSVCSLVL